MRNLNKYLLTALLTLFLLPAMAQESKPDAMEQLNTEANWYVGLNGGMPFGVSDFSSFGADKTRTGFMGGIYGGYRFDGALKNILSLEAFAKWGKFSMSERDCCADVHYWLGADGVRYNVPVLNMNGWDYSDLKSKVFMQQYGLQLNVNVLGFFASTRESRWSAEVSPLLAAVGSKAAVVDMSDGASVMEGSGCWHFGVGGNVQAGYEVTGNLRIGVYTGMAYLTGKAIDGMPELHNTNYVWESGIRVGWTFGKRKERNQKKVVAPVVADKIPGQARNDVEGTPASAPIVKPVSEPTVTPAVTPTVEPDTEPVAEPVVESVDTTSHAEESSPCHSVEPPARHSVLDTESPDQISLPVIYFAFNSTRIRYSELAKVQQIRDMMQENPEMTIEVIGWCDSRGETEYNKVFSEWRADAVKRCLVSYGIDAERIATKGMGIDADKSDAKARRAESVTIECEEK